MSEEDANQGGATDAGGVGAADHAAFLAAASSLLAASLDYETTLRSVARLAVPRLADWCGIDMVEPDGTVRQLAVAHVDPTKVEWARELRRRYPLDPNESSGIFQVLRSGRPELTPAITDDMLVAAARDAEHLRLLRDIGFTSLLIVPLVARGRTLGALSMGLAESGRTYSPPDLALAEEVARRAALAVDNARLYQETQAARARAERLRAITAALSEALTPDAVARVIAQEGLPAFGADAGAIFALGDDGRAFELLSYTGYAAEDEPRYARVPNDRSGPLQDAARTRALVVVESAEEMVTRWPHLAAMQATSGDAATVAAPLLIDGRVLGVLYLAYRRPRRFGDDDRAFLTTLGRQCAQALERARLYAAEREARTRAEQAQQRLAILAEAGAALTSSLDYETTLQNVAHLVVPALADWCSVYEATAEGRLARVALTHADPALEALMRDTFTYPLTVDMDVPLARVARTGRLEMNPVVEVLPPTIAPGSLQARDVEALRPASSIIVPLAARGHTLGVLGLFFNSSGRRYDEADAALAEELARRAAVAMDNARLYRAAQDAIGVRDKFLAGAAHELKTPLTSLLGNAELVLRHSTRERTLTERDLYGLRVVVGQARRQRALVEALLDLSLLQAGRPLAIERAPLDLCALVGRVVQEVQMGLVAHTLTCETPEEALVVDGDKPRLEWVVYNLLSNAVKYSPAGGAVSAKVARQGDMALLAVADQGLGVTREEIPRLFARFYRASNADPDQIGGIGIGLYLLKEIVTLHDGEVALESVEGRGSTFKVCLPLARP